MTVYVEKEGPVTIIILSRPEVRNAVDRETAKALAEAFHSFESNNEFKHGLRSLEKEAESGAVRFTREAGRHGHFGQPDTGK